MRAREPSDLTELAKLIDYMARVPHTSYIPAANMWSVLTEANLAELEVTITLGQCEYYAAEKKQARNLATEALHAYHRLRAAIAKFDALSLQQTEYEEQMAQKQPVVQEQ